MYRFIVAFIILSLPLVTFVPVVQAQTREVKILAQQSADHADHSVILQQKITLLLKLIELLKQQLAEINVNSLKVSNPSKLVAGVDFPKTNNVNNEWEFCSDLYFGGCEFEGLHEVRYGHGSNWVVKEYFDGFPGWWCHPNTFGVKGEENDHCEVSKVAKTGTLNAPMTMMKMDMTAVNLTKIPLGAKGEAKLNITKTDDFGVKSDIGAFRIPCRFSHMAFNDPIVYPGQPGASHLHTFFGNTAANAYSTATSIANTGNSTCPGGIANRSSYWIPSLIDTTTGTPLVPTDSIWYYKTAYGGVLPSEVKVIPDGLKIITGNAKGDGDGNYYWECSNDSGTHSRGKYIPKCEVGESLKFSIGFPQCWDGVNLDSSDHKSHMAFPDNGCPSSHPVALPELSLNISFAVGSGDDTTKWRLASDMNNLKAGHSAHADFFEGWNKEVKNTFTKECLNKSKDCHAFLLGNGTILNTDS